MKIGALVKIKENTEDPRMPTDRMGIIVKLTPDEPNIAHVRFNNGNILMFHHSYIETISEVKKNAE